ncbi:MAG: PQQ-binding-like beta-propeller repeat protein, partial [Pirellulaceae bacterium]|nr:PQQ-binding-like beta-propeller repeat protein [Pirellulaceae bacterium]
MRQGRSQIGNENHWDPVQFPQMLQCVARNNLSPKSTPDLLSKRQGASMHPSNACLTAILPLTIGLSAGLADDWPQWRGADRDGVWRETGLVDRFEFEQIEIRWRQPIGPGYSGPTVADGRVFVTDRQAQPEQVERVHCFDWKLGSKLWTFSYPCEYTINYEAGPRASVTVEDNRAFVLGAMGHLHCLDAGTGKVLWKRDLNQEYSISKNRRMPIWGIAAAPLIYEDLVIVHIGAANNASIVAFDKKYGDPQWKALRDRAQ